MKLPNSHLAIVEREKIIEYLLNDGHPDNGGKAAFFLALGFSIEQWVILASALRELGREADVVLSIESSHGIKCIVEGRLRSHPDSQDRCALSGFATKDATDRDSSPRIPRGVWNMIKEHERVVLTSAVIDKRLEAGDVGSVVHVYRDGETYEVEFVTLDGQTAAVVTVEASQIRPVAPGEIPHARELVAA